MGVSVEINLQIKGIEKEPLTSYFDHIAPSIGLQFKHALESALVNQPCDPVRYISSYLAEHADDDYQSKTEDNEVEIGLLRWCCPRVLQSTNKMKSTDHLRYMTPSVHSLRQFISSQSISSHRASKLLVEKLDSGPLPSRTGYLKSFNELIGPNPLLSTSRKEWMMEWRQMYLEQKEICEEDIDNWDEIELRYEQRFEDSISERCDTTKHGVGWDRDSAEAYTWLSSLEARGPIGRALRDCSPRYSKCTYALLQALSLRPPVVTKETHHMSYRNLNGPGGLANDDENWNDMENPDANGFKGLTTTMLCRPVWKADYFSDEGFRPKAFQNGETVILESINSDIVGFRSEADDEHGMHSGLQVYNASTAFPPNTLFRLKHVCQPGTWKAPGGCRPKQRLLVVTATHRLNKEIHSFLSGATSKLCGDLATLTYATRETYIRGLSDVLDKPLLTMEQEWTRDFYWKAFDGKRHFLRDEWAYVINTVPFNEVNDDSTGKTNIGTDFELRDLNNMGRSPDDFLRLTNSYIRQQRNTYESCRQSLPAKHSELSLDEVLAVRLYTGPGFVPINSFLRQLGMLTDEHIRKSLAMHAGLTFTATVGHLCRAVRKLAAATSPDKINTTLYRGVRGTLPKTFWLPDKQDMVCAVDCGFVSTSLNKETPIQYMSSADVLDGDGGDEMIPNVLWKLETCAESDSAYHRGADVQLLSQFSAEEEVLFPPCTMIVVKEHSPQEQKKGRAKSSRMDRYRVSKNLGLDHSGRKYLEIEGKPFFI